MILRQQRAISVEFQKMILRHPENPPQKEPFLDLTELRFLPVENVLQIFDHTKHLKIGPQGPSKL